jgi:hypothetical protein
LGSTAQQITSTANSRPHAPAGGHNLRLPHRNIGFRFCLINRHNVLAVHNLHRRPVAAVRRAVMPVLVDPRCNDQDCLPTGRLRRTMVEKPPASRYARLFQVLAVPKHCRTYDRAA